MTHSNHDFSIIIPNYNRTFELKRAVNSVLNQSFPFWELIIVDDGSNENVKQWTNSFCRELAEQNQNLRDKIKYIPLEKNGGVSQARNIGIQHAKFSWIALLDSDDEWLSRKLEIFNHAINSSPKIHLWHCNEKWIRNGVFVNQMKKHKKEGGDVFLRSLELCLISPSAVVFKKDVIIDLGAFDPAMIVCEDYDLWLRFSLIYEVGMIEEALLVKYGGHEDQLSHRYKAMDWFRVLAMAKLIDHPLLIDEKKESLQKTLLKKLSILKKGYEKHNRVKELREIEKFEAQWASFLKRL